MIWAIRQFKYGQSFENFRQGGWIYFLWVTKKRKFAPKKIPPFIQRFYLEMNDPMCHIFCKKKKSKFVIFKLLVLVGCQIKAWILSFFFLISSLTYNQIWLSLFIHLLQHILHKFGKKVIIFFFFNLFFSLCAYHNLTLDEILNIWWKNVHPFWSPICYFKGQGNMVSFHSIKHTMY